MTITLATLKDATAQQVFDQVVAHMIKQGERSIHLGSMCLYRSPTGLKCAAGCLIADDEYQDYFDDGCDKGGGNWSNMVFNQSAPDHHKNLIITLQSAHDHNGKIETVLQRMREIGASNGFNLDVFDTKEQQA